MVFYEENMFHLSGFLVLASTSPTGVALGVLGLGTFIAWVVAMGREERRLKRASRDAESSIRAPGPLRERLGYLLLYEKPLRFGMVENDSVRTWPVTSDVTATVEAAGNVSVTRGRNLAAKAIGGALVPGGVFFFGNAKETVHDHRELFLIVEGPDWAYAEQLDPSLGSAARKFALAIGIAARSQEAAGKTPEQQLQALARSLESGAITRDEYEDKKQAVLARVPGTEARQTEPDSALRSLTELRDAGVLSDKEFAAKKAALATTPEQ